jgi:hypothetical protein
MAIHETLVKKNSRNSTSPSKIVFSRQAKKSKNVSFDDKISHNFSTDDITSEALLHYDGQLHSD